MKKLFGIFLCTLTLLTIGCSKDDNSSPDIDPAQLIGTWEKVAEYYEDGDKWDHKYGPEANNIIQDTYKPDGSYEKYTKRGSTPNTTYATYTVDGDIIHMDYKGGKDDIRIAELTSTELVLAYDYEDEDSGKSYTDLEYFKRTTDIH